MKRLFLITLVAVFSASVAAAQVGNIGLFADNAGADCNIVDNAVGLKPIYVVHVNAANVSAVQFSAVVPACFGASFLSDTAVWPVTVGNSQTGVAVGYGVCLSSPIHVLTINVFAQGLASTCCQMTVAPHSAASSGEIEVVDCANDLFLLGTIGGTVTINPDGSCMCSIGTEETTWGQVKALYQDN